MTRGAQWRLLEVDGNTLHVRAPQADAPLASIDTSIAAELQRVALHEACAEVDAEDLRLALMVPASRALRRALALPLAARSRLHQVVAYEMDRQTPFSADQVHADVREGTTTVPGKLAAELVAVPKAWLDPWLERIAALDVQLDAVDVADADGRRIGVNLLPDAMRRRRPHRRRMLNWGLALLALLLVFAGMQWWLHNRREALATMQAQVDAMRDEARAVVKLRKQVQERLGAAGFLARRKAEAPGVLAVLDDLSQRLPEDTWLTRMNIGVDGRVGMQGESPQAAHLIDLLKASPYLDEPGFQGVIQTDPRTGHERFYIVAQLHKNGSGKGKSAQGGQSDATASR